jgi:hypothetical protein
VVEAYITPISELSAIIATRGNPENVVVFAVVDEIVCGILKVNELPLIVEPSFVLPKVIVPTVEPLEFVTVPKFVCVVIGL